MTEQASAARGYEAGGIALAGAVLVGIGLGILYGEVAAGTLLGIGVGLLLMGLLRAAVR